MNLTNKRHLAVSLLMGLVSFASSVQTDTAPFSGFAEEFQQTSLTTEANTSGTIGKVIFARGQVFDHMGSAIETGTELGTHSVVIVGSDGFLAIELLDGSTLNIQPDTSTSIGAVLKKGSNNFVINASYASGGIRS